LGTRGWASKAKRKTKQKGLGLGKKIDQQAKVMIVVSQGAERIEVKGVAEGIELGGSTPKARSGRPKKAVEKKKG